MARLCSYCGGRVVRRRGRNVHATAGERIRESSISPGDFVSRLHNQAGTVCGPHDIVSTGGVKRYMIGAVHAYSDNLALLLPPYTLRGWRGWWTIRVARPVR